MTGPAIVTWAKLLRMCSAGLRVSLPATCTENCATGIRGTAVSSAVPRHETQNTNTTPTRMRAIGKDCGVEKLKKCQPGYFSFATPAGSARRRHKRRTYVHALHTIGTMHVVAGRQLSSSYYVRTTIRLPSVVGPLFKNELPPIDPAAVQRQSRFHRIQKSAVGRKNPSNTTLAAVFEGAHAQGIENCEAVPRSISTPPPSSKSSLCACINDEIPSARTSSVTPWCVLSHRVCSKIPTSPREQVTPGLLKNAGWAHSTPLRRGDELHCTPTVIAS